MSRSIGFIVVSHRDPPMVRRLMTKLTEMFDRPRIVCHHDFSKCALGDEPFGDHVSFVRPHIATGWGDFSVVEATVMAIRQMFTAASAPDWFVLLSGADYPIKPAAKIVEDLFADPECDGYLTFERIDPESPASEWQKECVQRYYSTVLMTLPLVNKQVRLRPSIVPKRWLPFSENLRCYAGSQWFAANGRAAEHILRFWETDTSGLARHCRSVPFSEETFFQCVLGNASHLKLTPNNWRYTDWTGQKSHPKTLCRDDLPKLLASNAHFARKFDTALDTSVLDDLDRVTR